MTKDEFKRITTQAFDYSKNVRIAISKENERRIATGDSRRLNRLIQHERMAWRRATRRNDILIAKF